MTRRKIRRLNRRGFTLMELLIVLGILVLLFAMVTPRLLGTQKKADIKATKIQIAALREALLRYENDMKQFPATEEGLGSLVVEPMQQNEAVTSRWDGPYLEFGELPKDPWGNEYQYEYPPQNGKGDYPDIWSYGPDGEDNTEDDIASWDKESGDEETEGLDEDLEKDLNREKEPLPDIEPVRSRPESRPTDSGRQRP